MTFYEAATQWHTGEEEMHKLLRVPQMDNPTSPYLTPHAANILTHSPIMALGTLDSEGRPWTTLWGGEVGFSRPVAQSIIGMKTIVNRGLDPVLKVLLGDIAEGEVYQEKGVGKMVSALAIDLESRRRVKLYGRMVAGTVEMTEEDLGTVQLVVKIEQSLGKHFYYFCYATRLTRHRKLSQVFEQETHCSSPSEAEARQQRPATPQICDQCHRERRLVLLELIQPRI